jgi:hypothetical protein
MLPFARVHMPCRPGAGRIAGGAGDFGGDGGAGEAVGLLEGPASEVARDTGANPRVEGSSMREADMIAQGRQDGRSTIESYKKSRSVSIVFGEV